ncbi:MAG: N-acetylmuramoyl-L-alanine amidase [Candidatus Binatia bacterium]
MGWRWWGPGALALVLGLAGAADAARLEAIRAAATTDGGAVTLVLSEAVGARSASLEGVDGALARVYVDLPAGTQVAPGVGRVLPGAPPITAVRLGATDDGGLRLVLDIVAGGAARLDRRDGGRTLVVTVPRAGAVAGAGERAAAPPASRLPQVAPSDRAGAIRARRTKIVLDPGHGGHDPGAEGFAVEKEVTLTIARQVASLLRDRLGAEVILTRDDDATLALSDRTARANSEGADLFVSIHANANPHGRLHGVETYVLDNTADKATNRLAAMENGLDLLKAGKGQTDLRYILSSLVQVGKMDDSVALANAVQGGIVRHLRRRYTGVTDLGVKRGPFYVLVGAYMPCVLVETAFLTHPIEGRRLARREYQDAIAEGLYKGIATFLTDSARARTL